MRINAHITAVLGILLLAGFAAACYYRFYVQKNYVVAHEAACNPAEGPCFVYECEEPLNEDGTECEPQLYKVVEKYASDFVRECGADVTECVAAGQCVDGDKHCEVTFCDAETEDAVCAISE